MVTAVLGSTARPGKVVTEPQSSTDADLADMARQFIAYAGPFTIVDNTDTVIHHLEVSLFTGWQGDEQPRTAHIDGNTLRIATDRTGRATLPRRTDLDTDVDGALGWRGTCKGAFAWATHPSSRA
ncbi:lipocalin-like domain-containing protein [Rhodococcus fascians]|nr:lipocalin-like domain-containing protein [Rhodococcus fascians]MBY4237324.1 lipocalin-like domain-containing protein [Rhodococcus fascians]MBY4253003.1 lipocalin-like domain-containing protein [Rhodococcus fascians]MBY4268757.1 lipocalin-like domain-containing protein [Rhodococcus fascians]